MNEQQRSTVLPTDPFEIALDKLIGQPNGAHTSAAVTQAKDFYGNVTSFLIQTVKWSEGNSVFVTMVNATGSVRFVLPPEVLAVMNRQADSVTTQVRRRHGQRLAEVQKASGRVMGFTPEMRKKAAETRKAKAAKRQARRQRKEVA